MEIGKEKLFRYFLETDNIYSYNDKFYFSAKNNDALISINQDNYECKIENTFYEDNSISYCAHAGLIAYKNYLYAIPRYSSQIIKYDTITQKNYKINVPHIETKSALFGEAILVKNKIICFPEFYERIMCIDVDTDELSFIDIPRKDCNEYIFASNAVLKNDIVLIPFYSGKQLLLFNSEDNSIDIKNLEIDSDGFSNIVCFQDYVCLIGNNETCYILDNTGNVVKRWKNVSGKLYLMDNFIWIVNKIKRQIYRIDIHDFVIDDCFCSDDFEIFRTSAWITSTQLGEDIFIMVQRSNNEMGFCVLNSNAIFYKQFDFQEFFRKKKFFVGLEVNGISIIDIVTNLNFENIIKKTKNIGYEIYSKL
jgi:hypothetical protein